MQSKKATSQHLLLFLLGIPQLSKLGIDGSKLLQGEALAQKREEMRQRLRGRRRKLGVLLSCAVTAS